METYNHLFGPGARARPGSPFPFGASRTSVTRGTHLRPQGALPSRFALTDPTLIANVQHLPILFYDHCNLVTDPELRLCFWSTGLTGESDEMRIDVDYDRAWMVGLTKTASGGAQVCLRAVVPGRDLFYQCRATNPLSPSRS